MLHKRLSLAIHIAILGISATVPTYAADTRALIDSDLSPETMHSVSLQQAGFSDLLTRVLTTHPRIRAAKARLKAAQARIRGAGLPLNNPDVSLSGENAGVNTYTVGISQVIDWRGKREANETVLRAELAVAEAEREQLRLEIQASVLDALVRLSSQRQTLQLSEQRLGVLQDFVRIAERRRKVGELNASDLELARLSLAEAQLQHVDLESTLAEAEGDYQATTGQNPPSQIPALQTVSPLPAQFTTKQLANQHPQIIAAQRGVALADARIGFADRNRKADPTISVEAGREGSDNLLGLSISIPWQINNDFRSEVDAAQAEAEASQQTVQQAMRSVSAKLGSIRNRYQRVDKAWQQWSTQGSSSVEQSVHLLKRLWRAGELDTTDYLVQIQQLLDTRIAGQQLNAQRRQLWVNWLQASARLNDWLSNPTAIKSNHSIEAK